MTTNFIKSVLAGIMIGIGGFAYLSIEDKYLGAFLFSLGLLTIISKQYNLYTGKIYQLQMSKKDLLNKSEILFGNFIGSFVLFGTFVRVNMSKSTDFLWNSKLENNILENFVLSIICGILMYLAVSLYAKERKPVYVIMPIMVFILSGCEHCIANMFYWSLSSNPASIDIFLYIVINILGNSIGSIGFYRLEQFSNKIKN